MIEVNKLNGATMHVNPDLLRYVEAAGDTVLVFMDGEKLIVRQSPSEIVARIIDYRRLCSEAPLVKAGTAAGF